MRRSVAIAVVMAAGLVAAACAPSTRYRVLTMFFDGVPVPEGVEPREDLSAIKSISPFRQKINALPMPTLAPIAQIVSTHKPYADKQCASCHSATMSAEELPHDATLCDQCHHQQRVEEGWNHGPINLGTCVPCHRPHNSTFPHLLSKPVPDICLQCHDQDIARDEEYHRTENLNQCIECHDPHRMY